MPHIRNLVNRPSAFKRLMPEAITKFGVTRRSLSESSVDGSQLMSSDDPRKLEALLSWLVAVGMWHGREVCVSIGSRNGDTEIEIGG